MISEISHIARRTFRALPSAIQVYIKQQVDNRTLLDREKKAEDALKLHANVFSDRCLASVLTIEDWQARCPVTEHALRWMLGLANERLRDEVHGQCTGVMDRPAYRIEKWLLETMPGLFVIANLYLPMIGAGPHPCILYQNGHWPSLDGAKTGFQDRYLWYPENGFALLVIDPVGFGEIPGVHPGTTSLNRWDWISKGYTPAGVEVWNAMRALDWLQSRAEIDSQRIGATGISGGGVMTQYLAALDDRVKVAVPSCSTFTIGQQVNARLVPQQCDCTFYHNVCELDFPEVLALIAPRPLLILGGRKDPIFPPAGFRAAFERARRVYQLYGGADGEERIQLVESNEGHTDTPHFLEQTRAWMCRWLKVNVAQEQYRTTSKGAPLPAGELRVTREAPLDCVNSYIDSLWLSAPRLEVPITVTKAKARREKVMQVLNKRIFRWFPQQSIPFLTSRRPVSGGYAGEMTEFGEYEFQSELNVHVGIRLLVPHGARDRLPTVLWVKGANENVVFPDIDEFLPLLRTHAVAILTPRFADRPLSPADLARIERSAALVGRSIAAMQVWDVLRAVAWLREESGIEMVDGITLYGRSESGIVGLYAALFDEGISHVILRDPPRSHCSGSALPTILRDTDIEEIAGLVAPRRLTLLGGAQDAMPITRAWFELQVANENFCRQPSLAAAVHRRSARHVD